MDIRHWIAHRLVPSHKYPLMCFGARICIHAGRWADIYFPHGVLVVRWRRKNHYAYFSPDGTPSRATWMLGRFND